ncbi:LolA family protein [Alkalicoccobacillus gibsonii]|uniref:LolA family protein n=1 Tax=Alkalicoccobacillus gibsonii TaxID=79881 RepID=UPI003F7C08C9
MIKRLVPIIAGSALLSGCFQQMQAEDIIFETFENDENQQAYHLELASTTNGEEGAETLVEWRDENGNYRTETYNNNALSYVSVRYDEQTAHKDYEDETIMYTDFTETNVNPSPTPNEFIKEMIAYYSGDFDIKLEGTEDVLDRKTYHLNFEVQEEHDIGLIGEIDLWVDSQSWVILKERIKDGDDVFEREATLFETGLTLPEDTFVLENEENFPEENFEESYSADPVTISEANEAMPVPFLVANDEMQLESSYMVEDYMFDDYYTLTLNYMDERGDFELYIEHEYGLEIVSGLEEETTVRNEHALIVDEPSLLTINWIEDGLQYLATFDGDFTTEEATEIVEKMDFYQP